VVLGVDLIVLPARDLVHSLTVSTAKAVAYRFKIGLVLWTISMTRQPHISGLRTDRLPKKLRRRRMTTGSECE
jgi:hypothetical protein